MRPRDNRFTTPAEVLVRLVFVCRTLFLFFGFVLALSAQHTGAASDVFKAVFFLAAALAGHLWLMRDGRLDRCHRSLDEMFVGGAGDDEDELEALLYRRALLEEKRGTPGFDPWAVQVVRCEISDYVSHHPEAARRLDDAA